MNRTSLLVASVLIALFCAIANVPVSAGQPLPPVAKFRGATVAEWSTLQNEWAIATGLGEGTDIPDTIAKVRFLPGSFGGGDFDFDVTIGKGTAIAFSPWFAFGETYNDGTPPDDPDDPFLAGLIDLIFEERTVDVWLDGELVQSGTLNELADFAYGPTYFNEPIPYADQTGPAVAAIWTIGVGAVFHPLPPGEHTILVMTDGPFFGPTNTIYNIAVE
jgi:hypothetical protein